LFLKYVIAIDFDNTRDILKLFEEKLILAEFAQQESIAREKFQKQLVEERVKRSKQLDIEFLDNTLDLGKPADDNIDNTKISLFEGFEQDKILID